MQLLKRPHIDEASGLPPKFSSNKRVTTRSIVVSFIVSIFLLSIGVGTLITMQVIQKHISHAASNTAVTTSKNDLLRTGQNLNETILTTTNVNQTQFGKRVEYAVDGQVYAQPLYLPNMTIGGTTHNVVFVATQNDSLYAFDADQTSATPISTFLWHRSFIDPLNNITTVSSANVSCSDINPQYGITSTPVIDPATGTLYVVVNTIENGVNTYKLHAVDVTTGNDMPSGSTIIQASYPGKKGSIPFNPVVQINRGLLLLKGVLYIDWASHCDNSGWNGWIMGYDAKTYQQTTVYNDTANGGGGGIWQGGDGIAADSSGNIYVVSGNGTFDYSSGGVDLADSTIKLSTQGGLKVTDYFTPFNQSCLDKEDNDFGSSGIVLLPTSNELVVSGKEGRIYVANRDNLGQYTSDPTLNCATVEENRTDLDKVLQEFPPSTVNGGVYGSPSYWNGSGGEFVYFAGANGHISAFQVTNGRLSSAATSQSPETFGFPGGNVAVSSNGSVAGTGVAWTIGPNAVLYAYDATNLGSELYNSRQNASRDGLPSFTKFSVPTVANGEVFVGTKSTLDIYGLLASSPPPTPSPTLSPSPSPCTSTIPTTGYNNIGISDDNNPCAAHFDSVYSYSAQALQKAGVTPGQSVIYNNVTFTWPNVPSGVADNYVANGQTIPVTPVSGATTLAFLGASTNGPSTGTANIAYTDGTSQSFALGFSDWTLNSGSVSPSYGNAIPITTPYRNNSAGAVDPANTYVFYADIALKPGKTVQSVTLPSSVSAGPLHVFAIATKAGIPNPSYNNIGISDDSNPTTANFDGAKHSYSASALQKVGLAPGQAIVYNNATFIWPNVPSGVADNYQRRGQIIPVNPVSGATTLAFLGAATSGPSTGTAFVTYTDGTSQPFSLGFSEWTLNKGTAKPSYGNRIVATMPYINPSITRTAYVFYTDVALQPGKTVQSVTLPTSYNKGSIHIFAISTTSSAFYAYNNVGISDDSSPTTAHFDTVYSYSAQGLQAAGATPGQSVVYNNVTFTWPNVPSGVADNYSANGQTIPVTSVSGATTLAFLGASANGPSAGIATISYTDGTSQTFTLGFSDWTLNGGTAIPSYGNGIAITTPYRNNSGGAQDVVSTVVFYADFALQPNKVVQSVTLPASVSAGSLHVFAIATK